MIKFNKVELDQIISKVIIQGNPHVNSWNQLVLHWIIKYLMDFILKKQTVPNNKKNLLFFTIKIQVMIAIVLRNKKY